MKLEVNKDTPSCKNKYNIHSTATLLGTPVKLHVRSAIHVTAKIYTDAVKIKIELIFTRIKKSVIFVGLIRCTGHVMSKRVYK